MSNYKKAISAVAGFLGVLATVLADGEVSFEEAGALASAAIAAYGVYKLRNTPSA